MTVFKVTIVGAGLIGSMLARELAASPAYRVTLVDLSEEALEKAHSEGTGIQLASYSHAEELFALLDGQDLCVSAVPNRSTGRVADAATRAKVHFLDFSKPNEDIRRNLEALAAERCVMLGCGLSPGLVENLALSLLAETRMASDLTIRVGVLPRFRVDRLGYGVSWNLDSAIDEYAYPAAAIRDGNVVQIAPMEQHETLTLDGMSLEAFTTSGGVGDLTAFQRQGIKNFTFKTLRYPGHLDYMQFLLHDLNLRNRRDLLRSMLGTSLTRISDDVVIIYITAKGTAPDGRAVEKSLYRCVKASPAKGEGNALAKLSSRYAAALIARLANGGLPNLGFVDHTGLADLGASSTADL
ncbi:saccharopine dehydrogenase C-terminal domain-containing protein [Devosia sp. 2618]|uniref:saccharopine dehydrogenase C-terminal domain-containing protein n=1 Tax=Devosia sp. 2618 TaxID=3156454 RepID=UPI00339A00B1